MQSRLIRSTTNIGLLVLVNLLWSTQFISFKLVSKEMGPITVSFPCISLRCPSCLRSSSRSDGRETRRTGRFPAPIAHFGVGKTWGASW